MMAAPVPSLGSPTALTPTASLEAPRASAPDVPRMALDDTPAPAPAAPEPPAPSGPMVPQAVPMAPKPIAAKGSMVLGAKRTTAKAGGLGVQKLAAKVDDSLFEQAPEEKSLPSMPVNAPPPSASSPSAGSGAMALGGSGSFRAGPSNGAAAPPPSTADSEDARKRFANAKSISSAQYFGQGEQDNAYERQAKIAQFSGASAISSDAYFGRDQPGQPGGSGKPFAGRDPLDMTASELVGALTISAKADLEKAKQIAGVAANRLFNAVRDFAQR